MLRRRVSLALVGLMVAPKIQATKTFPGLDPYADPGDVGGGEVVRRLRMRLQFRNPTSRALKGQKFFCYLPKIHGAAQQLIKTETDFGHRLESDEIGHQILALEFEDVQPWAQPVVTVTVHVRASRSSPHEQLADHAPWLKPERFIESDHLRVHELASRLRQNDEWATARSIFEWVRSSLTYAGYIAEDLGALYALQERQGDCTEYANLVVALARANSIPARMLGGYVVQNDAVLKPTEYHNWAEIYLGGAWRVVDAQKGAWLASPANYIAFRVYRDAALNEVGLAHRYRLAGELMVQL